jgi:hypothetical protein
LKAGMVFAVENVLPGNGRDFRRAHRGDGRTDADGAKISRCIRQRNYRSRTGIETGS